MPMSKSFEERLTPLLPGIVARFGSPFHLYDEQGMLDAIGTLKKNLFVVEGDRNFYAVKANPNLAILRLMLANGFGLDCSSPFELSLAQRAGAPPDRVMFSSNDTSRESLRLALEYGCILNLDDVTLIEKLPKMPELISFRYNPGELRQEGTNSIIGDPPNQKFGVRRDQISDAYRMARDSGATRFGIHTMYASNQRDASNLAGTLEMVLELAGALGKELGIRFEFVNVGGGLGIPYRPGEEPLDVVHLGKEYARLFAVFETENGYRPKLYAESGRYLAGPHGIIVGTVINVMDKYRKFVGVDFSELANIPRAAIYPAYHHLTVFGKDDMSTGETVDVAGPLCENFRLAKDRVLPHMEEGDLIIVHDTGAHGVAMASQYNGWPQAQQLLLCADGSVRVVARATSFEDYIRTQIEC
ncbi:MAG: diaminopimelate decarboxylase [Candidatus Moranbacteria bacterium]|nr:diaminopimelate decarboxylase [Candidatus Moranbacteria bacterium]